MVIMILLELRPRWSHGDRSPNLIVHYYYIIPDVSQYHHHSLEAMKQDDHEAVHNGNSKIPLLFL